MNIHFLKHVPFEGPAFITQWAKSKGHRTSTTHIYKSENYPDLQSLDCLMIMGGSMNIYNESGNKNFVSEKKFIEMAIKADKKIFGFCLGSQILADILGAKVYPGQHKEIGWWPIKKVQDDKLPSTFDKLPPKFVAFHWHGDTYDIPSGAIRFAESEAFPNQGFIYDNNIVAMQFHLEMTKESADELVLNCSDDLVEGPFIQSKSKIIDPEAGFGPSNNILSNFLTAQLK